MFIRFVRRVQFRRVYRCFRRQASMVHKSDGLLASVVRAAFVAAEIVHRVPHRSRSRANHKTVRRRSSAFALLDEVGGSRLRYNEDYNE